MIEIIFVLYLWTSPCCWFSPALPSCLMSGSQFCYNLEQGSDRRSNQRKVRRKAGDICFIFHLLDAEFMRFQIGSSAQTRPLRVQKASKWRTDFKELNWVGILVCKTGDSCTPPDYAILVDPKIVFLIKTTKILLSVFSGLILQRWVSVKVQEAVWFLIRWQIVTLKDSQFTGEDLISFLAMQ